MIIIMEFMQRVVHLFLPAEREEAFSGKLMVGRT